MTLYTTTPPLFYTSNSKKPLKYVFNVLVVFHKSMRRETGFVREFNKFNMHIHTMLNTDGMWILNV